MAKLFTTKYTSVCTGTGYAQLRDWQNQDLIPTEIKSDGQGKPNLYSTQNQYQITLFATLTEHGVPRSEAKNIILEFTTPTPKKPYLVVYRDGKAVKTKWMTSKQLRAEELDRVTIINVENIVKEVDNKIVNLS